ncbi:CHAD domain-containing protein [Yinghuangia sp. YIM S09857]|uniref:CYTH and CHAD domain-containing protein n=1 Tax=Yinghuangia sp. YIM S09857 TaxID=3436929 RepID=UPI003F53A87D
MAATRIETERKYEGGAADIRLDPSGLPGVSGVVPAPDEELDAVYYDTADLRLLAHGTTLRKRAGGHDEGWHLKRGKGDDRREEIQVPTTDDDVVPEELHVRVKALARGKPLVPVLRMRTRREREHLVDGQGGAVAEIARDHVAAEILDAARPGGRRPPGRRTGSGAAGSGGGKAPGRILSWAELEVELENDAEGKEAAALLDAVEKQLVSGGWHRSASASKTARVFADGPGRAAPRTPRKGSAGQVVHDRLVEQVRVLVATDPGVRLDEDEAVHDMRVAARRLRSLLRSYRRLFDRSVTDPVADELRWLGRVLGDARDHEVLAARLTAGADRLRLADATGATAADLADAGARIHATEGRAYDKAREAAVVELDKRRYYRLLDTLAAMAADPPLRARADREARPELRRTLKREQRRLAERVAAARSAPVGQEGDAALHAARKAAKRARYAGETAQPFASGAGRFAKRTKAVQRLLGEHQDAVVARSALRRMAAEARATGADSFAFGLLYAAEDKAAAEAAAKLPKTWKRAKKRKLSRV